MIEPTKARPTWQDATVSDIHEEGIGSVSITFSLELPVTFLPGQYVNIRFRFPDRDKPVQRSYSIASAPSDPHKLRLIIAKVDGGLVSTHVYDSLSVGDKVDMRGPYGKFTWTKGDVEPMLMISAGSGVVPFLSMLDYMNENSINANATLINSSRDRNYSIGLDVIERLDKSLDNIKIFQTFTRNTNDEMAQYHRRIDKEMLVEIGAESAKTAYICGPDQLVHTSKDQLIEIGLDPDSIKTEIYP